MRTMRTSTFVALGALALAITTSLLTAAPPAAPRPETVASPVACMSGGGVENPVFLPFTLPTTAWACQGAQPCYNSCYNQCIAEQFFFDPCDCATQCCF
ncbi:MAG: hypothetical protein KDD47_05930 [Acidobacteria bacterium]|nr:hypothetical protein [Acidobacteriota bacterium]